VDEDGHILYYSAMYRKSRHNGVQAYVFWSFLKNIVFC
jgi:hypothetical protein